MIDPEEIPEARAVDLARECVYRFLAALATDPYNPVWERKRDPDDLDLAIAAMDVLRARAEQNPTPLTFGELEPSALDLRPLVSELSRSIQDIRADYDRTFGLVIPKDCPPYETEYHPPAQTFLRSQQLADIAGFYRAFGVEPGGAAHERPDHIALELEFAALLLTKKRMARDNPSANDQVDICDEALRDFVRDHLAWWVPAFAAGLRRKAGRGLYHALANVLAALVPAERQLLGVAPPFQSAQPALIEEPEEQPGCAACPLLG